MFVRKNVLDCKQSETYRILATEPMTSRFNSNLDISQVLLPAYLVSNFEWNLYGGWSKEFRTDLSQLQVLIG